MKKRICLLLNCIAILLIALAGCRRGEDGGGRAGTALARIQIGAGMVRQRRRTATVPSQTVLRQRAPGIPADVDAITLSVTAADTNIPGSPFTIPLETGSISIEIIADTDHLFVIEAKNQRGDVIFRNEPVVVNLPPGAEESVSIDLVALEITTSVASQLVSAAAGGVVEVTDPESPINGLSLNIPAGALVGDTTITVSEVNNSTDTPVLSAGTGVLVDLGPDGTTFATPATLTFPYDETLVQELGLNETNLRLFRFTPALNQWLPLPDQTADTTNNVLTAQLTSLSLYGMAAAGKLVRIGPPPATVASGATFTVPVTFDAGETNVISYLFELAFDPAVVVVTQITTGSTAFDAPITNPAAFSTGIVRFAASNSTFTPASGLLTLANISFEVVGSSGVASPLELSLAPTPGGISVMVDDGFKPIGSIAFVPASVTVQ